MDTRSKILFSIFGAIIVLSVSASYYKFIVLQDYLVEAHVDCDPSYESCFIWICDPDIDGEDVCTGNVDEDTWYFKIAYRNSMNVPNCNPAEDDDCEQFTCPTETENQCSEVLCTTDTLIEYDLGSTCTNPTDFQVNSEPIEDNSNPENTNETIQDDPKSETSINEQVLDMESMQIHE